MVDIAASIMCADLANIREEINNIEKAGVDAIHVDVMDGHFVRNFTLGPNMVSAIKRCTELPVHVHMMVLEPMIYFERFIEHGADTILFHIESTENIDESVDFLDATNTKVGLAISPDTPIGLLEPFLNRLDTIAVMGVNPGFSGQRLLSSAIERIKDVAYLRETTNQQFDIIVDGGVNIDNAKKIIKAGADQLVSGSCLFKSTDYKKIMKQMKGK